MMRISLSVGCIPVPFTLESRVKRGRCCVKPVKGNVLKAIMAVFRTSKSTVPRPSLSMRANTPWYSAICSWLRNSYTKKIGVGHEGECPLEGIIECTCQQVFSRRGPCVVERFRSRGDGFDGVEPNVLRLSLLLVNGTIWFSFF